MPCTHSTCSECSAGSSNCLWCPSLDLCLSPHGSQSYAFTFPFGQCLGYITHPSSCPGTPFPQSTDFIPHTNSHTLIHTSPRDVMPCVMCDCSPVSCDSHVTCDDCHSDPECGWCRDPADTGLGTCSAGGFLSPLSSAADSCPNTQWFFEQCPGLFECVGERGGEC